MRAHAVEPVFQLIGLGKRRVLPGVDDEALFGAECDWHIGFARDQIESLGEHCLGLSARGCEACLVAVVRVNERINERNDGSVVSVTALPAQASKVKYGLPQRVAVPISAHFQSGETLLAIGASCHCPRHYNTACV